jgi:phosphopentomutase
MLYGHRNDVYGYYKALQEFDTFVSLIISSLKDNDIFIITADHGCDPTTPSTDHSREYVPLLIYGNTVKKGVELGTRNSFSDLAQTLAELWCFPRIKNGESFLKDIL